LAKPLDIRNFLAAGMPMIDVRSEGEFAAGHIPGAISMPLFNNTERAEIGTLYKQQGRQTAILKGLEFAGAKLQNLAASGLALAHEGKIAVHCWRGGMRSSSVAWLLEGVGLDVIVLSGGYKSYRRLCLELFATPHQLTVIGGKTGSQKTDILHELQATGTQTLDLEALANHRGSAFGYSAEGTQPTQEQFENDIGMVLFKSSAAKPLLVEDESRLLGRLHIPDPFWFQMRSAPVWVVEWPVEKRIVHLTADYQAPAEKIRANLKAIHKRLGMERYKAALSALDEGRMDEVCRVVLDYYDRTYSYGLSLRNPSTLSYLPGETAREEIQRKLSCKSA
jgi:tRNA 2-selenouridine synthase